MKLTEIILLLNTALLCIVIAIITLPRRTKKYSGSPVLLDTSAIMDGRIVEVVRSGFVPQQLLVPRFVIAELQLLADKADHLKRERARYGLQVIQDLQDSKHASVTIIADDVKEEKGVDEKLVQLALRLQALLFTTDYNLLKVAEIEGVRVLNINELAQNLRLTHIPGEQLEIKIVAKGQEKTQGVGYLEDGTMVVVEKAGSSQGKTLKVEITRSLQTAAGRMMFARFVAKGQKATVKSTSRSSSRNETPRRRRSDVNAKQSAEDSLISAIENS